MMCPLPGVRCVLAALAELAPEASAGSRFILCLAFFLAAHCVERDHLNLHNASGGTVVDGLKLMHEPGFKAALVLIFHVS